MKHVKELLKKYIEADNQILEERDAFVTFQELIDELQGAIEQDEKENGWIPVSERLPEIKKNYLECYLVTDGRFCWMAYLASEKEWVFAECTDCKNKIDWADVVAWMPLPELYKEDEP